MNEPQKPFLGKRVNLKEKDGAQGDQGWGRPGVGHLLPHSSSRCLLASAVSGEPCGREGCRVGAPSQKSAWGRTAKLHAAKGSVGAGW